MDALTPLPASSEPLFVIDLRDAASGKRVAVRISRTEAMRPLGELARGIMRADPTVLATHGQIAASDADTFFRLQDLIFPVDSGGALAPSPHTGLVWRQRDGAPLTPDRPALFERVPRRDGPDLLVLSLEADRMGLRYERNWHTFHARRYHRFHDQAQRLALQAVADASQPDADPSTAAPVTWPAAMAHPSDSHRPTAESRPSDDPGAQRRFVERLARRIWRADFENYSRFTGPAIRLKTGDETVESLLAGRGGVCTEKVLALKYLTDACGIVSAVVFAGPHTRAPLPLDQLREMLDELDVYDFTYARRAMRYWDHVALEYQFADRSRWLVDPSNGNTPFLCHPAAPYLDDGGERRAVPVQMLAVREPVTYHRVPESLGLDFLFAWETWIADVDLMQVFDNNLGLLVAREFWVTAAVWGSVTKRGVAHDAWRRYAATHGLEIGIIADDACGITKDERQIAAAFAEMMPSQARDCLAALPGLARRYAEQTLIRHGIDKRWNADLVILDRRPLLARQATTPDDGATTHDPPARRGRASRLVHGKPDAAE